MKLSYGRASVLGAAVAAVTMLGTVAGTAPAAAAGATGSTDWVSVSGHGSAKGVPDTLIANLDAHAKATNAQAALDAASATASKVVDALRANGVADSDIQTSGLSVGPHYTRHGHRNGFEADESITARIHPLDQAGDALDAAASAGGNQLRIEDASLTISHKAKFYERARANAFASARSAAEQYAELAGRQLGRVMTIKASVRGAGVRHLPIRASAGAAAGSVAAPSAAIPVNPGKQTIRASVRVVWALK